MRMKINFENVTANDIEFVIYMCRRLMKYHDEETHLPGDPESRHAYGYKKYHEGRRDSYDDVLDMFKARGIIEEDSEDGQT